MKTSPRQSLPSRAGMLGLLLVALGSCAEPASDPVGLLDPAFEASASAKGGGPSVSSSSPSWGHQGDAEQQVTIVGSGFATGAVAAWERNGVPDPKLTVLATQVVSPTQIRATISIATDAEIALYDISVTNPDRKKGIGTSMFEVTTAEFVGTLGGDSWVNDIDDQAGIAGYCTGNGACLGAFYHQDAVGMVALGTGQAWGNDPLGSMVLGRDGAFKATAWVSQPGGGYATEYLPNPGGGGGNAYAGARTPAGVLIVGGQDAVKVKNTAVHRPAVWTRSGSSWSGPVLYAFPGTQSSIFDLNGSGQAVGRFDGSNGIVWEDATTFVVLDGLPWSINDAGTVIVGERNGLPVYWVRDVATNVWRGTGVSLPSLAASPACNGILRASDVNDAGIVVGTSCNGKRQATVWRLDMSARPPTLVGGPEGLPGLGGTSGAERSSAVGITRLAPYTVAGNASPNGISQVVRWPLP